MINTLSQTRALFDCIEPMEPFPTMRLTRQEMERAALDLGAQFQTIRQWRYRNIDTGGEFGDGRKSRALRHFDSRMRMSLRESRRFLIDNLSFHLILQSMDGHVTSIAPNRPDS